MSAHDERFPEHAGSPAFRDLTERVGEVIADQVRSVVEAAEEHARSVRAQAEEDARRMMSQAEEDSRRLGAGIDAVVASLEELLRDLRRQSDRLSEAAPVEVESLPGAGELDAQGTAPAEPPAAPAEDPGAGDRRVVAAEEQRTEREAGEEQAARAWPEPVFQRPAGGGPEVAKEAAAKAEPGAGAWPKSHGEPEAGAEPEAGPWSQAHDEPAAKAEPGAGPWPQARDEPQGGAETSADDEQVAAAQTKAADVVKPVRVDPADGVSTVPCSACDGEGSCPGCKGSGKRFGRPCGQCDKSGRCEACGGVGVQWVEAGE